MQMFIPCLKTKLRLTKDWAFTLFCEARNRSLWDLKGNTTKYFDISWEHRKNNVRVICLHKGDVLSVERVYIRKDQAGYNSITLRGQVDHNGETKTVRFWVVLNEFNLMHAEVIDDG